MKKIYLLFILLVFQVAFAQKNYDIKHLDADIEINPFDKMLVGNLTYQIKILKNVDSIVFDAPGILVNKVKVACYKARYKMSDKHLIINKVFKKGKVYKIKIKYIAKPKKAMYFVGWHSKGRKQVWTQGQGKNNSHWLPTNDDLNDKFTWRFKITFLKDYKVISNGELVSVKAAGNTKKVHQYVMRQPAPAYLIFIGAGKYEEQSFTSNSGIKVYNYQYADRLKNDKTYYKSKDIFEALEQEIGVKYAWQNYKQIPIKDFFYGGMENVSATSFNADRYVVDSIAFNDTNFVNVSAHELTHQWFGDLITGNSSYDHWLHESFATYYARLIDARILGKNFNDYNVYRYDNQIIKASKTDTIPLHRPNASSLTYYQKGAKIVAMMRDKIGDKNFRNVIKNLLHKYAYKNATTSDFKQILFEETGDSLPQFFNFWFETNRIPKFVIRQKKDSIIIEQNTENMHLIFMELTQKGYNLSCASKSFKIDNYADVIAVIPNPDRKLLAEIDYYPSDYYLKNQALYSPNFVDKLVALKQIAKMTFEQKDSIFDKLIQQENYYPIYKEIIHQIKDSLNERHIKMLQKLFDKDLQTRKQIAIEIDRIPHQIKTKYFSLLNDASYISKQMALWHYWQNFKNEREQLLNKMQDEEGDKGKEFRIMWLTFALVTEGYQQANKRDFINEIISYSSPDYNMTIRQTAFQTLNSLQIINKQVIDNLIDASFHFNWRMNGFARGLLKELYEKKAYKNMIRQSINQLEKYKKDALYKYLSIE
jgi:aminopeptidase N